MLLALHPVDYAVVALLLSVLVAIGLATRGSNRSVRGFFLANKGLLANNGLAAIPAGVSLAASLLPAFSAAGSMLAGLSVIGVPAFAYDQGMSLILIPLAMWLIIPWVWSCVLPLYHGLGIVSVYEYLELRFNRRTRAVASMVFIIWKTVGIAALLGIGCQLLLAATGWRMPLTLLILLVGAVTTTYTFLGGIKAVVHANTLSFFVIGLSLTVVTLSLCLSLEGGATRLWEIADGLGRTQTWQLPTNSPAAWQVWAIVPYAALTLLVFFTADQVTLQRLLAVRDVKAAQRAFMVGCTLLTIAVVALSFIGLGLLAYFHEHPHALRAKWVTNVDPATRQARSVTLANNENSQPARALDWDDPHEQINAVTIPTLVEQGRILRPNTNDAMEEVAALLDPSAVEGISPEQLLTRYPPKGNLRRGEVALHTRANDELLPWYTCTRLPWGLTGLAMAAMLAAIMSTVDGGMLALSGMIAGRRAEGLNHDSSDESPSRAVPITTLVTGVVITMAAVWLVHATDLFRALLVVTGMFGGPLLGIFLLGIFSRRANSTGVLLGLVSGLAVTGSTAWAVPASARTATEWALPVGLTLTLFTGYLTSLITGAAKPLDELRGLVRGQGRLGERDAEVVPKIKLPTSKRWR